jgi:hypothetical protein
MSEETAVPNPFADAPTNVGGARTPADAATQPPATDPNWNPDAGDSNWDSEEGGDEQVDFGRPMIKDQSGLCTLKKVEKVGDSESGLEAVQVHWELTQKLVDSNGKEVYPGFVFSDYVVTSGGTAASGSKRAAIGWETLGKIGRSLGTLASTSATKNEIRKAVLSGVGKTVKVTFKVGTTKTGESAQNFRYSAAK